MIGGITIELEQLYGVTYKVTLDKTECPSGTQQKSTDLRRMVHRAVELIERKYDILLIEEQLVAERIYDSDGGCVLLLNRCDMHTRNSFFACEPYSLEALGALCRALSAMEMHITEDISVYFAEHSCCCRVLLKNPSLRAEHICREYGECSEVSPLFAAQTAERLNEAACGEEIVLLGDILNPHGDD